MLHQTKAIEMNNHAVSQLERGHFWHALETCHGAIRCLDRVQCRLPVCNCRLLSRPLHMNSPTCVMTTISKRNRSVGEDNHNDNNNDDEDDDDDDVKMSHWFEGNQSHISGHEWVDCRPKQLEFHEDDRKARTTKSTHSSAQAEQINLSHDFRIAFLSLDAVKIFSDWNTRPFLDDEVDDGEEEGTYAYRRFLPYCDCDTRWGIYHNMGIVYHILGISLGECGFPFLERAHECYSLAQSTIPSVTPFADMIHLLLSGQNNQLTIYQEFAMTTEWKACLDRLKTLLAAIPFYASLGTPGLESSAVLDHEILLNLMVLTRSVVAPAA